MHKLRRGEYIVVHGMGGCGKSTLVIEALNRSQSLIIDAFNVSIFEHFEAYEIELHFFLLTITSSFFFLQKKVFWLTIGRESSAETLTVLQEFYGRLHYTARGYKPPNFPLDVKSAKQLLIERLVLIVAACS